MSEYLNSRTEKLNYAEEQSKLNVNLLTTCEKINFPSSSFTAQFIAIKLITITATADKDFLKSISVFTFDEITIERINFLSTKLKRFNTNEREGSMTG